MGFKTRTPHAMRGVLRRMKQFKKYTARDLAPDSESESAVWQVLNRARKLGYVHRTNADQIGRGVKSLFTITRKGQRFLEGKFTL